MWGVLGPLQVTSGSVKPSALATWWGELLPDRRQPHGCSVSTGISGPDAYESPRATIDLGPALALGVAMAVGASSDEATAAAPHSAARTGRRRSTSEDSTRHLATPSTCL